MSSPPSFVKVVLVTGGSSGLGKAICQRLAAQGHRVYGTTRTVSEQPSGYRLVGMDITDTASVQRAVEEVLRDAGHIDVVVNNAGVGVSGPTEGFPPELAAKAFDTNVIGAHRVCNAVLPHMRAAGQGRIVVITSLAADFGLAYRAFYSATKAALERYTASLAMEVRGLGIDVYTIRPGDFRSNIAGARIHPAKIAAPYKAGYERTMAVVDAGVASSMEAEVVAARIAETILAPSPRTSYVFAKPMEKLGLLAKAILPGRVLERMLMKHYQ